MAEAIGVKKIPAPGSKQASDWPKLSNLTGNYRVPSDQAGITRVLFEGLLVSARDV